VEPLYARHVLHRPPSQFALFEAAAGIGAILAGLAISRLRSRSRSRSMPHTARPPRLLASASAAASATAIGYGLAACLFTGTTSLPAAYAGAFAWGAAGSVFGAVALTALQHAAPLTAHGRVMSVAATLQAWVETAGLPLGGLTLAVLGVRPGTLGLAAVTIAVGLLALALLARSRRPARPGRKPPANPQRAPKPHRPLWGIHLPAVPGRDRRERVEPAKPPPPRGVDPGFHPPRPRGEQCTTKHAALSGNISTTGNSAATRIRAICRKQPLTTPHSTGPPRP
jgi:cytochrome b561